MRDSKFTVVELEGQAKALREYLAEQGQDLGLSKSLEAVSRSHGFEDWNAASSAAGRGAANGEAAAKGDSFWERCPIKDVDIETTIYAPVYVGWQKLGGSGFIPSNGSGVITVSPLMTPFFEPKAMSIRGADADNLSVGKRFIVDEVSVGRVPQLASSGLLSDTFDYPGLPELVNMALFSCVGLGREMEISISNPNDQVIEVFACIWGNPVTDMCAYA